MPDPDPFPALRAGTRRQHREVERALGLPGRVRSRADLAATLAAMRAAWRPLEDALATVDWTALGLAARLGAASDLIEADLRALAEVGATPGPPDAGPAPAVAEPADLGFGTLAGAVGGRYVLLGSALGGRIIAPALDRRLGPGFTRFFRRAGADPDGDWATFRVAVAGYPWTDDRREQAVESARRTFDLIGATATRLLGAGRGPA